MNISKALKKFGYEVVKTIAVGIIMLAFLGIPEMIANAVGRII